MLEDPSYGYFAARPEVSTRMYGDQGAVLFNPDSGLKKELNSTGAFIWTLLDGSRHKMNIADEILDSFSGALKEKVNEDLELFLNSMIAEGFVSALPSIAEPAASSCTFPDVSDGPQMLDISLTGKCNLHCDYCYYSNEMETLQDLPGDDWLTFFKELKSLAVQDLNLSGGEIFTRDDLWILIDSIIECRMRYNISTNGTLITEETLKEFEKGKRRMRLTSIQVSIDGSCPEVHDRSRGMGSFENAIRGLRLLKDAGFPVTVRVTVNRYNVDDLDNIAHLLLDEIGIGRIGTNDAMPMGAGCDNQKTIILTPVQKVKAMKTLARLARRYEGRIRATAGPLANWRSYQEMEHAHSTGELSKRFRMGYLTACTGMFGKLSVHHNGVVTPCNLLTKMKLGRINRDSLKDIWKYSPELNLLKERCSIPMKEVPGCEDCEWVPYCNGGCPGLAFEMTGDVNRANPHDCYRNFLRSTGGIDFDYE